MSRFANKLLPSVPDRENPRRENTVALAEAVEHRFIELSGSWLRVRGEELPIPTSLESDLLRWRKMRVRHVQGDYRHTESELKSLRTIAQWTVDRNCELRGQEKKLIEWECNA